MGIFVISILLEFPLVAAASLGIKAMGISNPVLIVLVLIVLNALYRIGSKLDS